MMKRTPALILILLLQFLNSCHKDEAGSGWKASITGNTYNSITEIFNTINHAHLLTSISSNDEIQTGLTIYSTADKIASYFLVKFHKDIRNDFVNDPQGIIILGLLYLKKEAAVMRVKTESANKEDFKPTFDCLLTAVSSVIGIPQARSIWNSIVAGASEETVIAALKLIGRRVAGIITIGIMVYEIGSCLDWW